VTGEPRLSCAMSSVSQAEIDALLVDATSFAAEAAEELAQPEPPPPAPDLPPLSAGQQLARILSVRVPVIVQLARRAMPVGAIRDFSVGAIIEFEKPVEEQLDLVISNRLIGHGICVKVGENFGLRVTQICDRVQRVRSLGPG